MIKYIFQNIWVGISRFLFIFYLLAALLVYLDLNRFWQLHLKLSDAGTLVAHYTIIDFNIVSIFFFSLLLPIGVTILKYLFRTKIRARLYETTRIEKYVTLAAHSLVFGFLLYLYLLSPYMQYLSGYTFRQGEVHYSYESQYYATVNRIALPINVIFLLSFATQVVVKLRISGKDPFDLLTHYNLWLALAYPEGELYPLYNKRLNFNAGAISPEIKFISKAARKRERIYQRNVPGSRDAAAYLQQLSNECKVHLFGLLKIDNSEHKFQIEFHTGTSRAIELALNRLPKPLKLIVSPYEHPSEIRVIDWVRTYDSIEVVQLSLKPSLLQSDWEMQEKEIETQLKEIVNAKGFNYVFLVSEVCYANGMVVPLKRLMDRVRKIETSISFLIDASHSVGNYQGSFGDGKLVLGSNDAYVFGSHKWLLSPEPCGVLVTAENSSDASSKSYDIWKDDLPVTTVGFARIGNFSSSLELILKEKRFESFMSLSALMKEEFIKSISDKFTVIGKSSNQKASNMIALKPKDGHEWCEKSVESLSALFSKIGVNCCVIDKGDDALWVRLTFLYFITYSDIKHLRRKLEKSIYEY